MRAFCRRQNLGGGGIHFRRAFRSPKGGAALWAAEPTRKGHLQSRCPFLVVEVGGVEPPSESTLTGLSPGADGYCGSLPSRSPSRRQAVTPPGQVRVMMHGRVNSCPPHGRHINDAFPGLWPLRFRRPPLLRQRQQLVCCCLIYKLPIFRMLGASARLSRLHTPVETGTPPRRYKLRSTRFRLRRKLAPLRLSLLFPS